MAVAAFPVIAQNQGQHGQPGQPGQMGQPGQPARPGQTGQPGQPSTTGQPLVSANEFKQIEQMGMIPLTQAVQAAEAQSKGKAVAVIPVRDEGNVQFNVYTSQEGQLTLFEIDAKTGRVIKQQMTNTIAELTTTRYAGHEEMGGQQQPPQQRGGQQPPPRP